MSEEKEIKETNDSESKDNAEILEKETNISENENVISEPLESYKILVIDDDKWIQKIFTQYLEKNGFTHLIANNAVEGLELAIEEKPLLIFLDIVMPQINGLMILNILNQLKMTKGIPIALLSSNLNKEIVTKTYQKGVGAYLTKPFDEITVLSKIKETLAPGIYNRMVKDDLIKTKI